MSFIFLPRSPSPNRSLSARHKKTNSFTKSTMNSDKKKANTILTSWLRNEKEAEEIRAKYGKEKNFFFSKDPNSKNKDEFQKNNKKNEYMNQKTGMDNAELKQNINQFDFHKNNGYMLGVNGIDKHDILGSHKNKEMMGEWTDGTRSIENRINSSRNNNNLGNNCSGQEKSTKNQEIKAFLFESESESKTERNSNTSFYTLDERKNKNNSNKEHISKVYSIKNKTKVINSKALARTSDEMSLLKEKRKELEKQAILLEKETQNRIKEKGSKKNGTENIITNLKNEHEKSKLNYNKYRSEKMEEKLFALWQKNRKTKLIEFFLLIRTKWQEEQNKIKQVENF